MALRRVRLEIGLSPPKRKKRESMTQPEGLAVAYPRARGKFSTKEYRALSDYGTSPRKRELHAKDYDILAMVGISPHLRENFDAR